MSVQVDVIILSWDRVAETIAAIEDFWMAVSQLPANANETEKNA